MALLLACPYSKTRPRYFESLLGMAVDKPARDWNDQDVDSALIALADFALRFRRIEVPAAVRGRHPTSTGNRCCFRDRWRS